MISNLSPEAVASVFRSAHGQGLITEEDTAVIFQDMDLLETRIRHLISVFPPGTLHGLAIKANPLVKMISRLLPLGTGVEAATTGEVIIAQHCGYPAGKIVFDSPVKTVRDLEFALQAGVHLNIDNLSELDRVAHLIDTGSPAGTVGIRINPQVGTGTIEESSVAGEYSKFGVPLKHKREELKEAFLKHPWLTGVHLHVGSQGCSQELLVGGVGALYDFAQEVNNEVKGLPRINLFDIGGGLPVAYRRNETPVPMEAYVKALEKRAPELFSGKGWQIITEFGRWVFVNSGWTLSRVEYVKHDPGINTAMIHVGADLFVRECLNPKDWQHEYTVLDPQGNLKAGTDENPWNLAGPLCFAGDILAKNVALPVVEEGDHLIIHDTGGYTFSMWSRYNSRFAPKILGYYDEGERFEVLKERENEWDILRFWE